MKGFEGLGGLRRRMAGAGRLASGWAMGWILAVCLLACAALSNAQTGSVWAWGGNDYGQLGDGTNIDRWTPVQTHGLSNVVAVAGGAGHSLALRSDGTVWAWGLNGFGQLGVGTTEDSTNPVQTQGLSNVVAIAGGNVHSLALRSDGTVWAWGWNGDGQLGDGTGGNLRTTPVQTQGLSNVVAISGGGIHSLALRSDGTVWAWGWNGDGQLGDGTDQWRWTPVQTQGLSNVVAIAGGILHSLALRSDGTVWAWGHNEYGELGDGTDQWRYTPVQTQGLSNVVAIGGGSSSFHNLALRSDGTVWAWGHNDYGQLGDGTNIDRSTPVQTQGLSNVVAVAVGGSYSLALRSSGTVRAWGSNYHGQLGDGTNQDRTTPVETQGLMNVVAVAGGGGHILALRNNTPAGNGVFLFWGPAPPVAPGDPITLNATLGPGLSGPVEVRTADGALRGAAFATNLLNQGNETWSRTIPRADFLRLARTNPVTLIATARRNGVPVTATTTIRIADGEVSELRVFMNPTGEVALRHNTLETLGFRVANPTAVDRGAGYAIVTLPPGLDYVSHGFDPTFTGLWTYNALTRQLRYDGNFSRWSQVGGWVRVRSTTAIGTLLPVTLVANSEGFEPVQTTTTFRVEDQLRPTGAVLLSAGGYGIFSGEIVSTLPISNGVRVAFRPKWEVVRVFGGNRRMRFWTDVVSTSGESAVPNPGALFTRRLLAEHNLIAPETSPEYVVEFTDLQQSTSLSSTLTQRSWAWTTLDQVAELISGVTGAPEIGPDELLDLPDYVVTGGAIGRAARRFVPSPQNQLQLVNAVRLATADIVYMTDAERSALVTALRPLFPTLTDDALSAVLRPVHQLGLIYEMLERTADLITVVWMTHGNPATVGLAANR